MSSNYDSDYWFYICQTFDYLFKNYYYVLFTILAK